MYEAHFQLHRRPFSPSADVGSYVGVGPVEQAGQTLLRVVTRGSGPALVIGSAGTGKSMLCELLAEHFGEQLQVALLANGQLANPKALFQAILFELGLPYREMDENELRLSLVEFLTDAKRCPQGLLLIVDEAHCLPLRILEEIRMLTNLVRDGQSRIHLVLAGGAALEERFTSPKLDSFNQRVAARCYLESLNREETATYIVEQITAAGGNGQQAFHGEALSAVYDATDGIPRLVNQVCDHALIMATVGGHPTVTADIVQEAWADLQQLPAPWVEPAKKTAATEGQHVIEFGTLEDTDATASVPFAQETVEPTTTPDEDIAAVLEPAGTDPDQQLDEIQHQIAAVEETYEEVAAQVEVAAPPAANPFEESFDEEEVIVDSYAALQEVRFANAPRVASHEGREIAALLSKAPAAAQAATNEAPVPLVPVTEEIVEETFESEEAAQQRQNDLTDAVVSLLQTIDEPANEDTLIDETEDDFAAEIHPISRAKKGPVAEPVSAPIDDRDLIIVEEADEQVESPKHIATGQARRQKYRQLFNRLRQA